MDRAVTSGRRLRIDLLAPAIVAVGFLLATLGILEVGGLFNVGLGLLAGGGRAGDRRRRSRRHEFRTGL